jgi:hypothetical protein
MFLLLYEADLPLLPMSNGRLTRGRHSAPPQPANPHGDLLLPMANLGAPSSGRPTGYCSSPWPTSPPYSQYLRCCSRPCSNRDHTRPAALGIWNWGRWRHSYFLSRHLGQQSTDIGREGKFWKLSNSFSPGGRCALTKKGIFLRLKHGNGGSIILCMKWYYETHHSMCCFVAAYHRV